MSLTGGPVYAARAGIAIALPFPMPSGVDPTDVDTVRLMATTPAPVLASAEWTVTIQSRNASTVFLRHVTDGTTNAASGEYRVQATAYDADGEVLAISKAERLQVDVCPVEEPPPLP